MVYVTRFVQMMLSVIGIIAIMAMPASGQPGGNRVAFGMHFGLNKYWGSFTDNQYWLGGDIFLRYNIIPEISVHGIFGLSQLRYKVNEQNILQFPTYFGALGNGVGTGVYPGEGTPVNREDINTVRINTYAVLLSYNVFASQTFVPYLFGGAGVVNFEPRNKNQNLALPNNRDNIYKKTVMVVPLGIGVEWYMSDNLTLNAKAQMHLVNSDYLDDLAEQGTSNDAFATFGAGFSYYIFGSVDCDKDGLSDSEEKRAGTDACNVDTDSDGLTDFEEIRTYNTNALKADTDDDGLNDFQEVRSYATNPTNPDTDNDGLKDGNEIARKTDPKNPDTDNDGLTDGDEVNQYRTDPTRSDTDGDNLSDKDEIQQHNTNPLAADSDSDGLSDGQEINQYHTDPLKTDSDGDGLNDGDEVTKYKTDPTNKDTDNDKLTDGDEILRVKTNPLNSDTDSDRVIDGDDACPLIAGVVERNGCPAPPKIGTILNFPSIYFLVNTDEFDFARPETDESLAKLLAYVKQCPGLGVAIEGHASREGGDKMNQQLSERRAARIKSWLLERGVEQETVVSSTGYGSRNNAVIEPAPNSTEARRMDPSKLEEIRSQNRRIAVKVVRTCDANQR